MKEYLMRGKTSYWPLYSLCVEGEKVIEVVRFHSLGPRQRYERCESSDFVKRTTFEKVSADNPAERELSDKEWLTKKIEEGKNITLTEDQTSEVPLIRVKRDEEKHGSYNVLEVKKLERLRLEDPVIRDCLSNDLNLEQLCRLHGLMAASNMRS